MAAARTILAALIALSLALSPATGAVATPAIAVGLSMSDQADTPCCPCCDKQDKSLAADSCGLKCMSAFTAVLPDAVASPAAIRAAAPSLPQRRLHGYPGSPPTHPPPV